MATRRYAYVGDGVRTSFPVAFPYINKNHVKVSVNGVPVTSFTWSSPNNIVFSSPPTGAVLVYGETPTTALVNFQTEVISPSAVDIATQQSLYVAIEVVDAVAESFDDAKDRSQHTGTQPASSISDLEEAVQDILGGAVEAGPNISVGYNDSTGKLVLSATGSLSVDWNTLVNRPTSFTPSGHTHSYGDIPGLSADLSALQSGKAGTGANTFTGNQTVSKTTPVSVLNKTASGQLSILRGQTSGNLRWDVVLGDDATEGGSNSGSDFAVSRFSDSGVFLGYGMTIRRSDGYTTIPGHVEICSPGSNQRLYIRKQADPVEGGEIVFEKSSASTLGGLGMVIDLSGDMFRIFEDGGANRGVNLNLSQAVAGAGSILIHSGNLGAQMANITAGSLGSYGYMRDTTTGTAPNATVAGSSLFYSSLRNTGGIAASGTWRCHGQTTSPAGDSSLFQRIL